MRIYRSQADFFVDADFPDRARCQLILSVLTKKCAQGGFHYLLPLKDMDDDLFDDDDEEDDGDDDRSESR